MQPNAASAGGFQDLEPLSLLNFPQSVLHICDIVNGLSESAANFACLGDQIGRFRHFAVRGNKVFHINSQLYGKGSYQKVVDHTVIGHKFDAPASNRRRALGRRRLQRLFAIQFDATFTVSEESFLERE